MRVSGESLRVWVFWSAISLGGQLGSQGFGCGIGSGFTVHHGQHFTYPTLSIKGPSKVPGGR